MARDEIGETGKMSGEIVMLARLLQTEMALGQVHAFLTRERAEDGNAERRHRLFDQGAMARAAHAVQHDAREVEARIEGGKAVRHRRGGLRLSRHVKHEQHGQIEGPRDLGGRAAAGSGARRAVEQPHGGFDEEKVGVAGRLMQRGGKQRGRHGPAVEIEAGRAGRLRHERRGRCNRGRIWRRGRARPGA